MSSLEAADQYAMLLHNEMQRRGVLNSLTWDDVPSGPRHLPTWLCIVYISGIEYGRSTAATKMVARNEAARQALVHLGVVV